MATDYLELRLHVHPEAVEAVCAVLHAHGTGGVVMEDDALRAYLPRDDRLTRRLDALRRAVDALARYFPGMVDWQMETAEVATEDWANAWRQYWHASRIGRRIVVVPSWERYEAAAGDVVIRLDPGMAFGTGQHASTVLCLQELEERVRPGMTQGDIGTGTGILAIASVLLGAGSVWAVDIDPVAVEAARENARLNGVADRIEIIEGGPERAPGPADLVTANLTADLHAALAAQEARLLRPGGTLLASGVIASEGERVSALLASMGLRPAGRRAAGAWACIAATRPASA